jgi:hypothetical protein
MKWGLFLLGMSFLILVSCTAEQNTEKDSTGINNVKEVSPISAEIQEDPYLFHIDGIKLDSSRVNRVPLHKTEGGGTYYFRLELFKGKIPICKLKLSSEQGVSRIFATPPIPEAGSPSVEFFNGNEREPCGSYPYMIIQIPTDLPAEFTKGKVNLEVSSCASYNDPTIISMQDYELEFEEKEDKIFDIDNFFIYSPSLKIHELGISRTVKKGEPSYFAFQLFSRHFFYQELPGGTQLGIKIDGQKKFLVTSISIPEINFSNKTTLTGAFKTTENQHVFCLEPGEMYPVLSLNFSDSLPSGKYNATINLYLASVEESSSARKSDNQIFMDVLDNGQFELIDSKTFEIEVI